MDALRERLASMAQKSSELTRSARDLDAYDREIRRRTELAAALERELHRVVGSGGDTADDKDRGQQAPSSLRTAPPEPGCDAADVAVATGAATSPQLGREELEVLLRCCRKSTEQLQRERAFAQRLVDVARNIARVCHSPAGPAAAAGGGGHEPDRAVVGVEREGLQSDRAVNDATAPSAAAPSAAAAAAAAQQEGFRCETHVTVERRRIAIDVHSSRTPSPQRERQQHPPLSQSPPPTSQEQRREAAADGAAGFELQHAVAKATDETQLLDLVCQFMERIRQDDANAAAAEEERTRLLGEIDSLKRLTAELGDRLSVAEEAAAAAKRQLSEQDPERQRADVERHEARAEKVIGPPAPPTVDKVAVETQTDDFGAAAAAEAEKTRLQEETGSLRALAAELSDRLSVAEEAARRSEQQRQRSADECEAALRSRNAEVVALKARLAVVREEGEIVPTDSRARNEANTAAATAAAAATVRGSAVQPSDYDAEQVAKCAQIAALIEQVRALESRNAELTRREQTARRGASPEASVSILHVVAEKQKIRELEAKVEYLSGEYSRLAREADQLRDDRDRLRNERDRLRAEIDGQRDEMNQQRDETDRRAEEMDQREAFVHKLATEHVNAVAEIKRLQSIIGELQRRRESPVGVESERRGRCGTLEDYGSIHAAADEYCPGFVANAGGLPTSQVQRHLQNGGVGGDPAARFGEAGSAAVAGGAPWQQRSGESDRHDSVAALQDENRKLRDLLRNILEAYQRKVAVVTSLARRVQLVQEYADSKALALESQRRANAVLQERIKAIGSEGAAFLEQREAELEQSVEAITALQTAVDCLRRRLRNRAVQPARGCRKR